MKRTRTGKIARLPKAVREELNRRLENGEEGKKLVEWLNGLPEVQQIVAEEFEGWVIREQNLSQWKQGGYQDWVAQQEVLEVASRLQEEGEELSAEGPELTESLTRWLTARYALATREVQNAEKEERWELLRKLCADVVRLRRCEQEREWLEVQRERLKLEERRTGERIKQDELRTEEKRKQEVARTEEAMKVRMVEWLKEPKSVKVLEEGLGLSKMEKIKKKYRLLEIFGMPEPKGLTPEALHAIREAAGLL